MSVARGQDRMVEDSGKARVAVLGDSRWGVKALQSRLVEEGFRLFSGESDSDAAGALPNPPDVVVFDVAHLGIAEQVEAMLRDCRSRWGVPILCLLPPSEHATPRTIARLAADEFLFKPPRALEIGNRIQLLVQRRQQKRDAATRD
ncbi:MAG: hypothetical protein WBM65_01115 [Sedimenticolaceae bacterium]